MPAWLVACHQSKGTETSRTQQGPGNQVPNSSNEGKDLDPGPVYFSRAWSNG